MRELLRHRRLVAAAHLREAGQAGADDEPLPVRRQLVRELLEEDGPNRTRPDETHVAAEDVEELRYLVELRRLEPAPDRRELRFRALHELLAELRADPAFGPAPQRPELEHREDAPAAADALAAVENGRPARHDDDQRNEEREREREDEQRRREHDVERTEHRVPRARRRLEGELPVPANERVLEPRRSQAPADRKGPPWLNAR